MQIRSRAWLTWLTFTSPGRVGDAITLLRDTVIRCERVLPAGDPLTQVVQQSLVNIGDS